MRQMLQTPDLVLSKASGFSNSGSITLEHIFPTEQNFSGGLNYSQPVDRSRGKAKSEDSTTFSKIHVWSSDFPHNEQTIELDERYFCAPSPGLDRRQASCHFLEPECHYFLSSNEELESNKNFKFNVSTCTSNPTPEFIVHGQMSHARGNSEDIKQHRNMLHSMSFTSTSANNYFWQYNSQCKGPKAVRLIDLDNPVSSIKQGPDEPDSTADCPNGTDFNDLRGPCAVDLRTLYLPCCDRVCYTSHPTRYSHMAYPEYPFVTFEDPVQRRYDLVHCSKLRRGDGNDVTPNLSRLRAMGEELDYLNQKLAEHGELIMAGSSGTSLLSSFYSNKTDKLDMMHITSSPECQQIEKAKREKNKLASKICRLKKKAFHEANKIKYTALGMEYDELIIVITQLKRLIREHLRQKASDNPSTPSCSGYPVSKGILVNGYQPRVSEVYPKETMNDYQCQFTAPMSVAAGPTECARSSLLNTAIQIWEKTNGHKHWILHHPFQSPAPRAGQMRSSRRCFDYLGWG
ncbi:unnamed protein product [Dicrocoelium dendriticum]|nr:unnamed protein product [Dicrocoelium dendriticum]